LIAAIIVDVERWSPPLIRGEAFSEEIGRCALVSAFGMLSEQTRRSRVYSEMDGTGTFPGSSFVMAVGFDPGGLLHFRALA